MEVLGGLASVVAVVQLSGKLSSLCWKYYADAKDARTDIENLRNEIAAVQAVLKQAEELAKGPGASKLVASKALIEKIPGELKEEFEKLDKILDIGKGRRAMRKFGRRALKWPLTKDDFDNALRLLERHKTTLITALNSDQMTVMLGIDSKVEDMHSYTRDIDLSTLPRAEGAAYNHRIWEYEDECLPGTRVELRRQIMAWTKDDNGAYIFWLNGMAGTGKSTISRTVARSLDFEERLAASFFFSRGRAIRQFPDISQQGLREQWKHLILEPLSSLKGTYTQPAAMVIVIDALDECNKEEDMQLILALLAQAKELRPVRLQVYITSRPETPILLGFRRMPRDIHQDFVLHHIPPVIVSQDISTFFQHKFALVKADHDGLSTPWPDEEIIQQLVKRAAGLFIYAATTYRFIRNMNYDPVEQLSLVLEESCNSPSPTKELDSMYTQILRQSVIDRRDNEVDQELVNRFRQTVGSIVIMFDVMAAKDLAALLDLSRSTDKRTLSSLRSLLNVPENEEEPVRTLHPSFRDFLLNKDRCLDNKFWIDDNEKHIEVFRSCLELMFKKLRRDMCDLQTPGVLASKISMDTIQKGVSPDLKYACRYWVHHFQRGTSFREDYDRILRFLNTHFLHWLEVLGLVGEVSEGVPMATALETHLAKNSCGCRELSKLAYDAKRFMLSNRSMIERAPLQVYYSALLFCPKRSVVREKYKREDPWILTEPIVIEDWSPLILTLEGHSNAVRAVAFSPDGKLVASASNDKTARLWDTSTGRQRGVLEGHSGPVTAVVFSPDGKLVASAAGDKTVRLWDASTGRSRGVLEAHSDWVNAIVFSPDGKLAASASNDWTVRLWDTAAGGSRGALEGHSDKLSAVFSPDGKLVASAFNDHTIRLWDSSTGGSRQILEGHSDKIAAVVFSPDGKLVASASNDSTVRLWDTLTGEPHGVLGGNSFHVNAVAFSPDGMLVASASNDSTVRLWETLTGESHEVLECHSDYVTAVVFSPDGNLVASASDDSTVRLWDTSTAGSGGILQGHSAGLTAVAFSPDGKFVASTSLDETLRLWDVNKKTMIEKIDTRSSISCLKPSDDGVQIQIDRGSFMLMSRGDPSNSERTSIDLLFDIVDGWITCNTRKLVLLPHDYRPVFFVVHGTCLAMCLDSGHLSLISFDPVTISRDFPPPLSLQCNLTSVTTIRPIRTQLSLL